MDEENTTQEAQVEAPPVPDAVPEVQYAPPAPAKSGETVADVNGNVIISYYHEGQRYAAVGATEADARQLLTDRPDLCRVP